MSGSIRAAAQGMIALVGVIVASAALGLAVRVFRIVSGID